MIIGYMYTLVLVSFLDKQSVFNHTVQTQPLFETILLHGTKHLYLQALHLYDLFIQYSSHLSIIPPPPEPSLKRATLTPSPQIFDSQIPNADVPTRSTDINPTKHEEHLLAIDPNEDSLSSATESFPNGWWE